VNSFAWIISDNLRIFGNFVRIFWWLGTTRFKLYGVLFSKDYVLFVSTIVSPLVKSNSSSDFSKAFIPKILIFSFLNSVSPGWKSVCVPALHYLSFGGDSSTVERRDSCEVWVSGKLNVILCMSWTFLDWVCACCQTFDGTYWRFLPGIFETCMRMGFNCIDAILLLSIFCFCQAPWCGRNVVIIVGSNELFMVGSCVFWLKVMSLADGKALSFFFKKVSSS